MTTVGAKERCTQVRIIELFTGVRLQAHGCAETPPMATNLGYTYLGDWEERTGNSNIEEERLAAYLCRVGYAPELIGPAIHQLRTAASVDNTPQSSLYEPNKKVYDLLRYGAKVKLSESQPTETVFRIQWTVE